MNAIVAKRKERSCLHCKEDIQGRSDKKFCDMDCRVSYNNGINRDRNNFMRNINNTLRKNRFILESLNPRGKTKVHRNQLLDLGFKFSYYTNVYKTRSGHVYHFCYDQGYLELDKGYFAIVQRQDYVEY